MTLMIKLVWWLSGLLFAALLLLTALVMAFWAPDKPLAELLDTYAPAPSQFIDIDGLQVHLRDEGADHQGPALILLHGTSASLHTWDGWVQQLRQQRRVIRVDLPGFGLTGPNAEHDYRMETYAAFVLAVADHLQLEQFDLGGNSLGGRIAWFTAATAPERVRKLILVDPSGGYRLQPESVPLAFTIAQHPRFAGLMDYVLPRQVIRSSVENVYGDPSRVTEAQVDLYYAMAVRAGNRQALRARFAQDPLDNPAVVAREQAMIQQLRQPTLILWGARDRLIPVAHAHLYAADMPHAQLHIFPELGHIPHEEDPQQSLQPVLAFLAEE